MKENIVMFPSPFGVRFRKNWARKRLISGAQNGILRELKLIIDKNRVYH